MTREERSADLGEAKKDFTFKPTAERFFLVGFLFLFIGLYGLNSVIRNGTLGQGGYDYFSAIVYLIGLIVSLLIFRHGFSLKSITVRLFEKGFLVAIRNDEFQFSWDEIDRVSETVVRKWGSGYWHILVTRNDGESFGFLEYELDGAGEFREAIRQGADRHGVSWETRAEP